MWIIRDPEHFTELEIAQAEKDAARMREELRMPDAHRSFPDPTPRLAVTGAEVVAQLTEIRPLIPTFQQDTPGHPSIH